jgi:RNA polymerase sigma-70 factor (ECF subfamily)
MTFMLEDLSVREAPSQDESSLIAGCRAGRPEAFDALVRLHYDRIHRLARVLAGPEAAADLAQETFLAVLKAFPRFRAEAKLSTWLISILRNQCSMSLRRRRAAASEPLATIAAPPPSTVDAEVRELLERVRELPQDLATTLTLFHVKGLSYAEIARVMTCPIGTVRSRLFEARERLRRKGERS